MGNILSVLKKCGSSDENISVVEHQPLKLDGDTDVLSEIHLSSIERLKDANTYRRVKIKKVAESFSGSLVLFLTPKQQNGSPLPSSILKIDTCSNISDEVEKTRQ